MNETTYSLLATDESAPITVHNANGRSPFLIVVDHASMPYRARSADWAFLKPNASATSRGTLVSRRFSLRGGRARRHSGAAELFPLGYRLQPHARVGVVDPGNQRVDLNTGKRRLSEARKAVRFREIFRPYHDRSQPSSTRDGKRADQRC